MVVGAFLLADGLLKWSVLVVVAGCFCANQRQEHRSPLDSGQSEGIGGSFFTYSWSFFAYS